MESGSDLKSNSVTTTSGDARDLLIRDANGRPVAQLFKRHVSRGPISIPRFVSRMHPHVAAYHSLAIGHWLMRERAPPPAVYTCSSVNDTRPPGPCHGTGRVFCLVTVAHPSGRSVSLERIHPYALSVSIDQSPPGLHDVSTGVYTRHRKRIVLA